MVETSLIWKKVMALFVCRLYFVILLNNEVNVPPFYDHCWVYTRQNDQRTCGNMCSGQFYQFSLHLEFWKVHQEILYDLWISVIGSKAGLATPNISDGPFMKAGGNLLLTVISSFIWWEVTVLGMAKDQHINDSHPVSERLEPFALFKRCLYRWEFSQSLALVWEQSKRNWSK